MTARATALALVLFAGCAEGESGADEEPYDAGPDACVPWDLDGDGADVCSGDCDDLAETVHPGAPEVCGDCRDQDCDGEDVACDERARMEFTPAVPVAGDDVEVAFSAAQTYFWALLRVQDPAGETEWLQCIVCEAFDGVRTAWTFEMSDVAAGDHAISFTELNVDFDETQGLPVLCVTLSVGS